jgi:hypothetical protein
MTMTRLASVFSLISVTTAAVIAGEDTSSEKKAPTTADFRSIRNTVETLRGKKFLREVPVTKISEQEMREMCDRELEKQYPGQDLGNYEELLAWFDMVPPNTDLKSVYADFMIDQVAGLYDSETKKMCIPSFTHENTNHAKPNEKELEKLGPGLDQIVLAHEFTHALEDQFWPIDDPKDEDENASTDRGNAHGFLLEGSATRAMTEAVPAQASDRSAGMYFLLWNSIHSGVGEFALKYALLDAWKSSDAIVEGVPETLSRAEAMPYSFGYVFCTEILRKWGLDGLDYIYDHRPISSEQIMHPEKAWEWRDVPVQVSVPQTLPGGWKQISHDCAGEAGVAVLFGCQFKNFNRGLEYARGWDGDRAVLFANPEGKRLIVWASSWDSPQSAAHCASAYVRERKAARKAAITTRSRGKGQAQSVYWKRPDGREGVIIHDLKHLVLLETDSPDTLKEADAIMAAIKFTGPAEDAARAAMNSPLRRFNPLLSWQRDGDYTIMRSLGGLLSRHDRNSVGSADTLLLGLVGESRRTSSFNKWELGDGGIARHESEARRGTSHTTLLPWGLLASHSSNRLPQSPEKTITRSSVLWGLAASVVLDESQTRAIRVMPFGLLWRSLVGPDHSSVHILGTGVSRRHSRDDSGAISRYRLLGFPIWTSGQETKAAPRKKREPNVASDGTTPGRA